MVTEKFSNVVLLSDNEIPLNILRDYEQLVNVF